MEIKNQFLQISLAAFVLAVIPQILLAVLSFSTRAIFLDVSNYQFVMFISYISAVVRYVIAPFLIFAGFYFIGKKPDLILKLRPILLALLIGNIVSFFVGSIVYSVLVMEGVDSFLGMLLQSLLAYFAANFLAALAGLSISHLRRKKLTLSVEPELS